MTGGTTAKIMVAAKDNFLGKYIYKDTLARNLAAVIYKVSQFSAVQFFVAYSLIFGTFTSIIDIENLFSIIA